MFVCTKCKTGFDDAQRAVGGYAQCRECRARYVREWREKNPGRNAALCQARKERDPERVKQEQLAYRSQPENAEKARERAREWYRANTGRALAWARENRDRLRPQAKITGRLSTARRRFGKEHSLSDYFRAEIRAIYANCPVDMEVDHIEPLNGGEEFCGLHVPWNLQYLTSLENRRKRNEVV
jgi:predicted  nucleic acid-binding Zn-ribbon protein